MKNPTTKAVLLSIAQDYVNLATMLDNMDGDGDHVPDPSEFKL